MLIRIPRIDPDAGWTAQGTDTAAKLVSGLHLVKTAGRSTAFGSNPADATTFLIDDGGGTPTIGNQGYYEFFTTPPGSNDREVLIGSTIEETLENLSLKIAEFDSTKFRSFIEEVSQLNMADTSGFQVGEVVEGQTSFARGIITYIETNTFIRVIGTIGAFTTETVLGLDSGETEAVTSVSIEEEIVVQNTFVGNGNDVIITGTHGFTVDSSRQLGRDGIPSRITDDTFDVIYDHTDPGTSVENLDIAAGTPTITDASTVSDLVTNLNSQVVSGKIQFVAISSAIGARIKIDHQATDGPHDTLTIANYVGTNGLFENGQFAKPFIIGQPDSDREGTDNTVRLYHPADPAFFRNLNRPLVDLADNDFNLRADLIGLLEGYHLTQPDDPNLGKNLTSIDPRLNFKAPAGYTFNTDVRFRGNIIIEGGNTIEQNTINLIISDKEITLNSGETGAGVGGDGESGLIIDRGTLQDRRFYWSESAASWVIDESTVVQGDTLTIGNGGSTDITILFDGDSGTDAFIRYDNSEDSITSNKIIETSKTLIETEQVSIGDGVNTFGTINIGDAGITNLADALTAASALLTSGGKIFIKRGSYSLDTGTNGWSIDRNKLTIVGEGSATIIEYAGTAKGFQVGTFTDTRFYDFTIQHNNASNQVNSLIHLEDTSNRTMIKNVVFLEVGAGDGTDVRFPLSNTAIAIGCISETTNSNL